MSIWSKLSEVKTLYSDPDQSADQMLACFPDAYEWMREQMKKRVAFYAGHFPWWGWVQSPKPQPLPGYVRIELRLRRDQVLLSNLPAWEQVLNRGYVSKDADDAVKWEYSLKQAGVPDCWPFSEPWKTQIVESWENIFRLAELEAGAQWSSVVQSTFENLALADVVNVVDSDRCDMPLTFRRINQ